MSAKNVLIKKLFEYGEMAFIYFDGIDKFNDRFLKASGKIEVKENNPVLCMGCGNFASRSFPKIAKATYILGTSDSLYGNVYRVEDNTIYKGMSGGPLIDLKTFKVIGVNYAGQEPGSKEEDYPRNVCSKIDKTVFKKMKRII